MELVKLPRLGVTMQSATITNWHKNEGDTVEKGEILFEMESEKTVLEMEAQASGVLRKILVPVGEEIPVGTTLAIIAGEDEEIDEEPKDTAQEQTAREEVQETEPQEEQQVEREEDTVEIKATPKARMLAREKGIDLATVQGSGPGNIITENDLVTKKEETETLKIREKVGLNNIQRAMSAGMKKSWETIPHFTQIISVHAEKLLACYKKFADVSINGILVKAISRALEKNPFINSTLAEGQVVLYESINVGVAMQGDKGLIVAVLKNTQNKSAARITAEIQEMGEKIKGNTITMEDISDGTITFSNLGSFGIEEGTPVINYPQSTLVFSGVIKNTPLADGEGKLYVAPIMKLSIGFDHRYIDGVTAAQFTRDLKLEIENCEAFLQ